MTILYKTVRGLLISATWASSKKILHFENVKQFLLVWILQWGLGGTYMPSSMKNTWTPAPVTLEICCRLSVPACCQYWQVAESNRKPHYTSQLQLAETQLSAWR